MASWNVSQAQVEVDPDPRPPKRHRASGAEEKKIRAAFEFACCVTCGTRPVERHHVVPRSQGGDDVIHNLAPLCNLHHGILEAHAPGWKRVAAAVRQYVILDRDRCVYVVGKIGWDRLNARYPMLSEPGGTDGETRTQMSSGRPGSESDWDKYEEPIFRYRPPEDEPDRFEEELSW